MLFTRVSKFLLNVALLMTLLVPAQMAFAGGGYGGFGASGQGGAALGKVMTAEEIAAIEATAAGALTTETQDVIACTDPTWLVWFYLGTLAVVLAIAAIAGENNTMRNGLTAAVLFAGVLVVGSVACAKLFALMALSGLVLGGYLAGPFLKRLAE